MKGSQKWWEKPLRVLQYNIEDRYGIYTSNITGKLLIQLAKSLRANTLVIFARDPWGRTYYENSEVGPKHPKVKGDLIKEAVEEGKKCGINVIVMIGHTANKYLYQKKTEWAQVTKDGDPIVLEHIPFERRFYEPEWPLMCINSPFMEYVHKEVEEVLSLNVDGVFLDSFRYQPDIEKACYCKWCQERFRKEFGYEMPREIDWSDVRWRELWKWRYKVVVDRIREISQKIRSKSKNVLLMYNSHPGGWAGRTNKIVEMARDYVDVVFAECSEADHQPSGFITEMIKLTKAMFGNKPVAASRNYFHMYRTVSPTTKLAIKQGLREAIIANGIPWILVFSSGYFQNPARLDAVREVFEEHETISPYMEGSESIKFAAIVASNNTRDFYGREHPNHYVDEVRGFYYALIHSHIPVEFISDRDLENGKVLDQYRLVILANTACMSDKAIENIKRFVENGGKILATYSTSTRFEDGIRRYEIGIKEVIGGELVGVLRQNWSYLIINNIEHPIFSGLTENLILMGDMSYEFVHERVSPVLGWHLILRPIEGNVLANVAVAGGLWGYEYTLGRSPPPMVSQTSIPGLIENTYHNGRALYFSGQLGRLYWRTGLPEYKTIIKNSAIYLGGEPEVTVDAPESVAFEAYQKNNKLIVHLLNHTYNQRILAAGVGRVKQPLPPYSTTESVHPPREVIPVRNVKIIVRGDVKSAYLPLRGNKEVPITVKEGKSIITIEELGEYEFVVLER